MIGKKTISRKWGYNIDGGYTIANRKLKTELDDSMKYLVDPFHFEKPGIVKFDVQMSWTMLLLAFR